MVLESSVISGSKSSYEFFCCQLGFRLGREIIWRYDAAHPLSTDTLANPHVRNNGRAPVPRFAQVRDNRKLRDIRHDAPRRTDSRLLRCDVNDLLRRSCGTSWPLRAGPPIDQRLKLLSYLYVQLHDTLVGLTLVAILGSDREATVFLRAVENRK